MVRTKTHLGAPSKPSKAEIGTPTNGDKRRKQQQPEPHDAPEHGSASTAATSDTIPDQQQQQHDDYPNNLPFTNNADKLTVMREGSEATIEKLRSALDEHVQRDATAKAALAKSDAVILELRSSVRQLKQQLEKKNEQLVKKQQTDDDDGSALLEQSRSSVDDNKSLESSLQLAEERHASEMQSLAKQISRDSSQNSAVGELQVQLDRAHAQILTADMVRKELEDTLEAEQYTWELRVQDQDRTIQSLQQTCATLQQDLDETRAQWSEAEQGWSTQLTELQQQLETSQRELTRWKKQQKQKDGSPMDQMQQKITTLEQERVELQACLDEAMQELEAVDAEIQSAQAVQSERDALLEENSRLQALVGKDKSTKKGKGGNKEASDESLRDLARWVHGTVVERGGVQPQTSRTLDPENDDVDALVQGVQEHVEALHLQLESSSPADRGVSLSDDELAKAQTKVAELEAQISVYRGDLQAREESSSELRASLQEAVALLKPLQEVVDKTEQEKHELLQELERLEQHHMSRLEQRALDAEGSSQHLQQLQHENEEIMLELQKTRDGLSTREEQVKRLEDQVESLSVKLAEQKMKGAVANVAANNVTTSRAMAAQPSNEEGHEKQRSAIETNSKLEKARQDLKAKRQSERALKQLLKDAQSKFNQINEHNREVEGENQYLAQKLSTAEKQLKEQSFDNASHDNSAVSRELAGEMREAAIQQLEQDIKGYQKELERKEQEVIQVKEQLHLAQQQDAMHAEDYRKMDEELMEAREQLDRAEELDTELSLARRDLKAKKEAEKVLNKSLKEALRLLQPLQSHLETAEREKRDLSKELKQCKRRLARLESEGDDAQSRSVLSQNQSMMSRSVGLPAEVEQAREDLEKMVEQLEDENSRLQDALEEISLNLSMSAQEVAQLDSQSPTKLKENFVELKSRYEVTNKRLDNANMQKSQLLDTLKKKEKSEKAMTEELNILREKLKTTDEELENAKYIATSALVKVEEMTMAAVEKEFTMSKAGSNAGSSKAGSNAGSRLSAELPSDEAETAEARDLNKKVQSLEREVQSIKQTNASLEENLRQRERKMSIGQQSSHSTSHSWTPSDNFEWDEFSRVLEETHRKIKDKRRRSPKDTPPPSDQLHAWDNKLKGAHYGEEDRYVF